MAFRHRARPWSDLPERADVAAGTPELFTPDALVWLATRGTTLVEALVRRPSQIDVLTNWFGKHQGDRDVIVKLHTGQGKTLIGLLMLQSRLNAGPGPTVYLCPNNYLVDQTREQARQFGIRTCASDGELFL